MYKLYAEIKTAGGIRAYSSYDNECFLFTLTVSEGRIKGEIKAKKDFEAKTLYLSENREYSDSDLFFANGYQSWTTSREFSKNDVLNGIMKAGEISEFTRALAGISGDYAFARYGKKGCFHSYTYCYFRKKDGDEITLYGSKSEKNGFTVFEADMNEGVFRIKKDIEGLFLSAGQEYTVFDLCALRGPYEDAFDEYFFDFAGFSKPRISRLAGYTSWYNYFQNINEKIILRDLEGLSRAGEGAGIFQIDDGYESAVGDWLLPDGKKFPRSMKYMADKIHEKGYLAGIWLAPFNAQRGSLILKKHPDWVIRDNLTGKKKLGCVGWGGAYTFDIYNEEFRAYLKKVFDTVLFKWGYDMVKLDFLYSQCMQPRGGKTRGEIMCDAVNLLRELCKDRLILGCGVPLGACMGVFDACRISCDADKTYESLLNRLGVNCEVPSSPNAVNNTVFRRHLNGRAFLGDPDVFFLRDTNIKYTPEQKLLHAEVNSLCGSVLFVSDNAGDYDEKTAALLREFFKERKASEIRAQYTGDEEITLCYTENGVEKRLIFNVRTGKSNITDFYKP